MARKRLLSPGFFENEALAGCSAHARLLFAGLWTLADREGRMKCIPFQIHGLLFPYESSLSIQRLINELSDSGFVRAYSVEGRAYLDIPSFLTHQSPHKNEVRSTCPPFETSGPVRSKGQPKGGQARSKGLPLPESISGSGILDPEAVDRARAQEPPPADVWDGTDLRRQLGGSGTVPPLQQPKWIGIGQQPREDVQALIEWASGRDSPLSAFLNCFDRDGVITSKRRPKSNGRRRFKEQRDDETEADMWSRIEREANEERAEREGRR